MPRGDDQTIVVTVHENDCYGDLFDVSGSSEIIFAVADEFGGTVRIDKRMSDGDVYVSTNGYQIYFNLTSSDTASLVRVSNYFELQVTTSDGLKKTILHGIFRSDDTMIRGIV